jgi:hypothetical protein
MDLERQPRSPSYPFINLSRAVAHAEALHRAMGCDWFTAEQAAKIWEMRADSSALGQRLSALKQFGLMDDSGRGKERRFAISALAQRIIQHEDSPDYAALREAALHPAIYADLWRRLQNSDRASLLHFLTTRHPPFSPKAAEDVLRLFRESAALAGLARPGAGDHVVPALENDELKDFTDEVFQSQANRIRIQYRNKPRREDFEWLRDYFDLKLRHIEEGTRTRSDSAQD